MQNGIVMTWIDLLGESCICHIAYCNTTELDVWPQYATARRFFLLQYIATALIKFV